MKSVEERRRYMRVYLQMRKRIPDNLQMPKSERKRLLDECLAAAKEAQEVEKDAVV